MTPTPKAYVKSALSHIGLPCGAVGHPYVSTPYWSHAIIQWLVDHVGTEWFWMNYTHSKLVFRCEPRQASLTRMIFIAEMHIDIRRRALRKQDREKKALEKKE